MDMLEQALVDHNMGDREASKDIIAEVDTDNVSMNNAQPLLIFGFRIKISGMSFFSFLLIMMLC